MAKNDDNFPPEPVLDPDGFTLMVEGARIKDPALVETRINPPVQD